jgi:hypothetical protein
LTVLVATLRGSVIIVVSRLYPLRDVEWVPLGAFSFVTS